MDEGNNEELTGMMADPLLQNKEFLEHHKEIKLDRDTYCEETIERIEEQCGCKVICNPHFSGISFYVENEYYRDAQNLVYKIEEEDRVREERREEKKSKVSEKVKKRFEERIAQCEHPDDNELDFAEACLKTLRINDYVDAMEAEKYRRLYAKYPEYFKLVGWPEEVEGDAAKRYVNSTLIKNI